MLVTIIAVLLTVIVMQVVSNRRLNRRISEVYADMEALYDGMEAIDARLLEVLPAYKVVEHKTPPVRQLREKPETSDWMTPLWASADDTPAIDNRVRARVNHGPPPIWEDDSYLAEMASQGY